MGQMSPSTRWALQEFVRFAGEYGATLYFDDFLKNGFRALPSGLQQTHAGLSSWRGMGEFQESLSALVGLGKNRLPLLANRTANLVKLAAKALFADRRRVLMSDLTWPSYAEIMRKESARHGSQLLSIPLRDAILRDQIKPSEVAERVADATAQFECGGVFLPAVSHDGIRFPLTLLTETFRRHGRTASLVVDGAQAFCHVPLDLHNLDCDFFVAGSHKWLGAYLPLGIGFVRSAATEGQRHRHGAGDPLLSFLQESRCNADNRFGETVNLMPLFSCRAAFSEPRDIAKDFAVRQANANVLAAAVNGNWHPILPHRDLRSGILLLRARIRTLRSLPAAQLRANILHCGISLTAYEGGILRLAMPCTPLTREQIEHIDQALQGIDTWSASPVSTAFLQNCKFSSPPLFSS